MSMLATQGERSRLRRRWKSTAAIAVCLGSSGLTGCAAHPATALQVVAVCVRPSATHPSDGRVDIAYRHGGRVVARGSIPVGGTFSAAVPLGDIVVYVDGKRTGSADGGAASAHDVKNRTGATYLSSAGCPTTPDAG